MGRNRKGRLPSNIQFTLPEHLSEAFEIAHKQYQEEQFQKSGYRREVTVAEFVMSVLVEKLHNSKENQQ